jgi:hypothetical protein
MKSLKPFPSAITAQAASAMESGLSADAAARVLAQAATAGKPRTRYTIGREAALLPLFTVGPCSGWSFHALTFDLS